MPVFFGSVYGVLALKQNGEASMPETTEIDKDYIDKRSDGWVNKVDQLYSQIKDTLKNEQGVEYKTDQNMVMLEELMEKYDVPAKDIPIFDLFIENQLKATFKPIGLWVVGAKGRIDILTDKGPYMLVDLGSDDAHPDWKVFSPENKKEGEPFNADFIERLAH